MAARKREGSLTGSAAKLRGRVRLAHPARPLHHPILQMKKLRLKKGWRLARAPSTQRNRAVIEELPPRSVDSSPGAEVFRENLSLSPDGLEGSPSQDLSE